MPTRLISSLLSLILVITTVSPAMPAYAAKVASQALRSGVSEVRTNGTKDKEVAKVGGGGGEGATFGTSLSAGPIAKSPSRSGLQNQLRQPAAAGQQLTLTGQPSQPNQASQLGDYELIDGSLPPFPEDANRPPTDWSEVDWDTEVTLPEARKMYDDKVNELERQGKYNDVVTLPLPKVKLSDAKAMEYYNIPKPISDQVAETTKQLESTKAKTQKQQLKTDLKEKLKNIQMALPEVKKFKEVQQQKLLNGDTQENLESNTSTANQPSALDQPEIEVIQIDPKDIIPVNPAHIQELDVPPKKAEATTRITSSTGEFKSQSDLIKEKLEQTFNKKSGSPPSSGPSDSKPPAEPPSKKTSFSSWVEWLLGIKSAKAAWVTPLISYYEGIEQHTMDFILYNWSVLQNANGSFGKDSSYEQSANIYFLLKQFGKATGDQYATLVNYLTTTAPTNDREKAVKIRVLFNLNQSTTTLLNELLENQNTDGGFGIKKGYESDLVTTLEALWAIGVGGLVQSPQAGKALNFVVSNINQDGSLTFMSDSEPSFYLINKTLEYFKPYQSYVVTSTNGITTTGSPNTLYTVQSKITLLLGFLSARYNAQTVGLQGSDQLQDLLGVLYSFQLYDLQPTDRETIWEATIGLQNLDGSFGYNMYTTIAAAKVFPEPDLIVTDIGTTGSLMNRQDSHFTFTIENKGYKSTVGNTVLNIFTDNYSIGYIEIPFTISRGLRVTTDYTLPGSNTLLGATDITIYAEPTKDSDYANNWRTETFTYAPDSTGLAAVPTYITVQQFSSEGIPGFDAHWKIRATDANRQSIILLVREVGTQTWNQLSVNPAVNPSGIMITSTYFTEGGTFEFKGGVQANNANQTISTYAQVITVRTTANDANYTGNATFQATVDNDATGGLYVRGHSAAGWSDESGQFSYTNIPNGSSAAWMGTSQYEKYITEFLVPVGGTTSNLRLFTTLKTDTQAPTIDPPLQIDQIGVYEPSYRTLREVQIVVEGHDAIALKEANFYYYNPVEAMWHFITSVPANRDVSTAVDFITSWYIPSGLPFSPGYKMKAVVWDYGNNSASIESDPFEILDGADTEAPTLSSVEVRGALNASRFNNQQTVQLYAFASDNIALNDADFYYYDPQQAAWNFISTTPAQNNSVFFIDWYVPPTLPLRSGYKIKATVRDTSGNSATAESASFEITDGTVPTGTINVTDLVNNKWKLGEAHTIQWSLTSASPLARIENIRLRWGTSGSVYVAQNYSTALNSISYTLPLDGRFIATDAHIDIDFCDVNENCATIQSSQFEIEDNSPGIQPPWQAMQVLDPLTTTWPLTRTLEAIYDNSDGSKEMVYTELETGVQKLIYRKLLSGTWQNPITMKAFVYSGGNEYELRYPKIQKTPNGDIHAVYIRGLTNDPNGQYMDNQDVMYVHLSNGSVVADRQISPSTTNARNPRIAVSDSGQVFIAWMDGRSYQNGTGFPHLFFASGNGTTSWDSNIELSNINMGYHAVGVDNSDPVVVFHDYGTGTLLFRKRTSGTWSSPLSIYKAEIPKTALDQYGSDSSRMSIIVDAHPQDNTLYKWKLGIRTKQDLQTILNNNGFLNTGSILSEWERYQYAGGYPYDLAIFSGGGNQYDVFMNPLTSAGQRTLQFLRFTAQSPDRILVNEKVPITRTGTDWMNGFAVLKNSQGKYNIFYLMTNYGVGSPYLVRGYHTYFDGTNSFFETRTTPYLVNLGQEMRGATELNNRIAMYYISNYGGQGTRTFASTADYSTIINNLISAVAPTPQSTGTSSPVNLTWSGTGSITGYDVYLGASQIALTKVATNTTVTTYTTATLAASTKYYWQIVGHTGSGDVYSNTFDFTTKSDLVPPTVSNLSPAALSIIQGEPSLTVTAQATDALSAIASAEISIVDAGGNVPTGGSWSPMSASDGAFNSLSEGLTTTVDTSSWNSSNSPYTISVRAADSQGNTSVVVTANVAVTVRIITNPEIDVQISGSTIGLGATLAMGSSLLGIPVDTIFGIFNLGSADLTLSGSPKVSVSGANAGDFFILNQPSASITAGQFANFTILFMPSGQGTRTATLSIPNNDGDESPFVITLSGEGQLMSFTKVITGDLVTIPARHLGAAFSDYDLDGAVDLLVTVNGSNNFLYHNNGSGQYTRVTTGPIVTDGGNSMGASWGDYDNDGDPDLFVANVGQNNFLYRNDGNGAFVTITSGPIVTDGGDSMDGSWADYDNDGNLDLLVANASQVNFLYHNNGDGTFTRAVASPVTTDIKASQQSSWVDWDNDGDQDLMVVNSQQTNDLYRNDGEGAFTKLTSTNGPIITDVADWKSVSWGDYDNDGDRDAFLAVENGANNVLYRNEGTSVFVKITTGQPVTDGGDSKSAVWGDLNNDGWLDLVVSNRGQNNALYINAKDGSFTKITAGQLVTDGGDSYGVALADVDKDGDLDVFMANYNNQANFLYLNRLQSTQLSLKLQLEGVSGTASSTGAKVQVSSMMGGQSVIQTKEVGSTTGTFSQSDPMSFFGLGTNSVVSNITITWPTMLPNAITNHSLTNNALLGWWRFDEGAGTSAVDKSGALNHGTITNGTYGAGVYRNALSFDGVSGRVVVPDSVLLRNTFDAGGQLSLWIKPRSVGESNAGRIISKIYAGAGKGWNVYLSEHAGGLTKLSLAYYFSDSLAIWKTATAVVPLNEWSNIGISYNASDAANDPVFYVNGISTPIQEDTAPVGTRTDDTLHNVYIGNYTGYDTNTFDGAIDEVRLFSAPLTPSQITDLYRHPGSQLIGSNLTIVEPLPEINVKQGQTSIPSGGTIDIGSVTVGGTMESVFTIENLSQGGLGLTGTPAVTLSGASSAMFTVSTQPGSTVAALQTTSFTLRFAPTSQGQKTVIMSMANNDRNENPYSITVNATGSAPTAQPTANFTSNITSGTGPLTVQFTDQSSGYPTAWIWQFGDGELSTVQNPTHTYRSTGTYSVRFTAGNAVGSQSMLQRALIRVTAQETIPFPENLDFNTTPGSESVPVSRIQGVSAGKLLGYSVGSGDMNGDGVDDMLLSGGLDEFPSRSGSGTMSIIYGSPTLSPSSVFAVNAVPTSATIIYGQNENDWLGDKVVSADINGDGFADMIVTTLGADPDGRSQAGKVYIIYGAATINSISAIDLASPSTPVTQIWGEQVNDWLGYSLASGDVNGDGITDLQIGAHRAAAGGKALAGKVYIIYGATDLHTIGTLDLRSPARSVTTILGSTAGENLGLGLGSGDVNGDGFADILLGSPLKDVPSRTDVGFVSIIPGRSNLSSSSTIDLASPVSGSLIITGDKARDQFGYKVTSGDLNGDGFAEIIASANMADPLGRANAGETVVIYGSETLLSRQTWDLNASDQGITRIRGESTDDRSGYSLATGDTNGDGFDELLVGAWQASPNGGSKAGKTYIVYGLAGGPTVSTIDLNETTSRVSKLLGDNQDDYTGWSLAMGDFNGDTRSDALIGAFLADPNALNRAGQVYVLYSGALAAAPEINVLSGLTTIDHGGSVSFETQALLSNTDLTFTIQNTGRSQLVLSGSPLVGITGTDASHFSMVTPPASTIASGASSNMVIRYTPTTEGPKTAQLSLTTNDRDEGTFTMVLTGNTQITTISVPNVPDTLAQLEDSPAVTAIAFGAGTTDQTPQIRFTLSDTTASNLMGFTLQIDDDGIYDSGTTVEQGDVFNYSTPTADVPNPQVITYQVSTTLVNGPYYWRVRAENSVGSHSEWVFANGGEMAFRVDTEDETVWTVQRIVNMSFDTSVQSVATGAIEDQSGKGNHATLGGGDTSKAPVWESSGIGGGAYRYDGSDDLMQLPVANLKATEYTVLFFINTTCANCGISSVNDGSTQTDRDLYLENGNICSRVWNTETVCTSGTNYADGAWHFITHVFGGRMGGQKLFIDGTEKASGSKSSSDLTSAMGITLGLSALASNPNFNGLLDELQVYNYALTAFVIASKFQARASQIPVTSPTQTTQPPSPATPLEEPTTTTAPPPESTTSTTTEPPPPSTTTTTEPPPTSTTTTEPPPTSTTTTEPPP